MQKRGVTKESMTVLLLNNMAPASQQGSSVTEELTAFSNGSITDRHCRTRAQEKGVFMT